MTTAPPDADSRRRAPAVDGYAREGLPPFDAAFYARARAAAKKIESVVVPPREARMFHAKAGDFFRLCVVSGAQVGDLNLWHAHNLDEHFFSGKTRQLHAAHLSTGCRMWSSFPAMRPMATITADTLAWYGFDEDGAGVHDVIGTRCDPYTNRLLRGADYHHCCHSNLARALAAEKNIPFAEAGRRVHDVLNVFMCTGFSRDRHQYFMKASPARAGDYLEFFAEIDLLGGLSSCPGGDCGATHSDDNAACHPLRVEIYRPPPDSLRGWQSPPPSGYQPPDAD